MTDPGARGRPARVAAAVFVVVVLLAALGADVARAAAPRISVERVTLSEPAVQVPALRALGLDVTEDVTPDSATVLAASDADRRALRATGLPVTTVVADYTTLLRRDDGSDGSGTARPRAAARSGLPSGRTSYRTPAEVQGDLDTLAAGHPGLVRRVVLGRKSIQGRAITGVEIAQNVDRPDDGRPVYVVFGEHHAREWASAEVATELALDLVARQAEPRIAALLAKLRIIIVPVVNPDGYAYSRGTAPGGQLDATAALKRRNCRALPQDSGSTCATHRGVDLNRNYGEFWGGPGASTSPDADTYRGSGPWSEPETEAVHELTQDLPVTGVQSLHNVAGLVLRPPGFRNLGLAPDEARLKALGDAMAAATGYASQYGYQLYDVNGATEDWNYAAQGAFGYTIELGGAYPGDPDFQGTYQTHVIDQYLGRVGSGAAGKGVREALLLAAEEAADPRDHMVLRGRAPGGATLTLDKRFDTLTAPRCSDSFAADACGPTAAALAIPDHVSATLTVGSDGQFTWGAGPSTRPFVRKAGHRETWTLRCRRPGRSTVTKQVFADRGQTLDVDPCDVSSLPRRRSASSAVAVSRVSAQGVSDTRSDVRRSRHVRVRVRCPVTCRVAVTVKSGSSTVAKRVKATLRSGRSTTVNVPLTTTGRRVFGRSGPRRLHATLIVHDTAGSATTVARTVTLRR